MRRRTCVIVVGLLCGSLIQAVSAAEPLEGYLNWQAFNERVEKLGKQDGVKLKSIGKSHQDRDLWVIELGGEEDRVVVDLKGEPGKPITRIVVEPQISTKPAWAVVGSIQPDNPLGSELALRMAEQLAEKIGKDEAVDALLKKCTLYIIPRPDPDGLEKCFAKPGQLATGNARATDDDRDFKTGEDPANDLNGDGIITMLRVEDESGTHKLHPDDPRVLIEIDSKKKESAGWRLLTEGIDDDKDETFNEDGSGGVNLNRNFTFHYPPFQPHSGPNAVSEPESRALAQFLFDRPQIAGVLTFTSEDNLFHPWKHDSGKDKGKTRNTIAGHDETVASRLAEEYRELHGGKDAPSSSNGNGSFSEWAYYHYGRWSFAARGWWVPKVAEEEPKKDEEKKEGDGEKKEEKKDEKKPAEKEKRGADDLNALRWLAKEKIDGFVDWKAIDHPGFPGKKVEVGGFKPYALTQPPVAELDGLATKHVKFLSDVTAQMAALSFADTKVENLGGKTYRITTSVINRGQLPTMPEMGAITEQAYPLQILIDLPKETKFLLGHPRGTLSRIKGQGDKAEKTWLVRFEKEVPKNTVLRVWAPSVGLTESTIDLPQ